MTACIEDILAGARALALRPTLTALEICVAADEATAYRGRHNRAHPDFGDGSISAAARLLSRIAPGDGVKLGAGSPAMLRGLRDMCDELLRRWRGARETHSDADERRALEMLSTAIHSGPSRSALAWRALADHCGAVASRHEAALDEAAA